MQLSEGECCRLKQIRNQALQILTEGVMPFWTNNAWDAEFGGFLTRIDRRGNRLRVDGKFLMMQARMLASLSWVYQYDNSFRRYLDLAELTFDFLTEYMWDRGEGGFFFAVDRKGQPCLRRKNTDAHAYALVGLNAYYEASGRNEVRGFAEEVYDLLQRKAKDGEYGFVEDFDGGQWEPLNAAQMNLSDNSELKTVDMHTNVLEAFTYLASSIGGEKKQNALEQVVLLLLEKGIHPNHGCTITAFTREWKPVSDSAGNMTTSFGLNVELAWLLLKANTLIDTGSARAGRAAVGLVDHALRFGFDWDRGGLAAHGPYDHDAWSAVESGAASLIRPWWTQAELMNALIDVSKMTGESGYLEALIKQWDWIWNFQIDHRYGSWYQEVDPTTNRPVTTHKGEEWKTSFHTSRALMKTVTGIDEMLAASESVAK